MEDFQRQRWCWQSRALEWLPLLQPAVPWGASGCYLQLTALGAASGLGSAGAAVP